MRNQSEEGLRKSAFEERLDDFFCLCRCPGPSRPGETQQVVVEEEDPTSGRAAGWADEVVEEDRSTGSRDALQLHGPRAVRHAQQRGDVVYREQSARKFTKTDTASQYKAQVQM